MPLEGEAAAPPLDEPWLKDSGFYKTDALQVRLWGLVRLWLLIGAPMPPPLLAQPTPILPSPIHQRHLHTNPPTHPPPPAPSPTQKNRRS